MRTQGQAIVRAVLVVGIDGVRFDTLTHARTPHIDAVAAAGFLAPVRVHASGPTISGPVWATVATGVLPPVHGISDNDLTGHRIAEHPDFLTRVRSLLPGATTYAAAGWPQLVHPTAGGPIFLGGGYLPDVVAGQSHDLAAWEETEEAITAASSAVLSGHDVDAAFVYFGAPDAVAHDLGVGPDYVASIERSDQRLGRLLAAIRSRPSYSTEEWTIVVVTDHGHVDAGGHGGDSDVERTAWIAACGPGVPTAPPAYLEQADVHAQVLTALGLALDPELAGQPFGTRRAPGVTPLADRSPGAPG